MLSTCMFAYHVCVLYVFVLYVFVLEARKNGPMAELPFQVKESNKKKKKKNVGLHSEFLGGLWLLNIPTWAVVARIFRRMK